ncbi:MAG: glutamine amidotransferase, partial [Clostridia bacterium]
MNITICHLYYDIMNLYGENGNFKVLCRHLENAGFTVEKTYKTINEKKDFSAYNIIYMGCGTEENQKLALSELLNEKQALNNFLNDDTKLAIFTGNSFEILGESIISADKKIY